MNAAGMTNAMRYTVRLDLPPIEAAFVGLNHESSMDPKAIEQRILQAMPAARVSVISEDQVHFTAQIVSDEFNGLSRIQRHRRVHSAIGAELGREIHALSLDLKTPIETSD